MQITVKQNDMNDTCFKKNKYFVK